MRKIIAAMLAATAFTAAPASALTTIGNTGIDSNWQTGFINNDASAPTDSQASSAALTNAATVGSVASGWLDNSATSQWVSGDASGAGSPGWYVYSNTFTAAAGDMLNFNYAADDSVLRVLLNGASVGGNWGGAYDAFTSGSVGGLMDGMNTVTFLVSNNFPGQDNGTNPTGFRFENVAAVPEPATWAMMLLGFGMVAGAARYRRRATRVTYA